MNKIKLIIPSFDNSFEIKKILIKLSKCQNLRFDISIVMGWSDRLSKNKYLELFDEIYSNEEFLILLPVFMIPIDSNDGFINVIKYEIDKKTEQNEIGFVEIMENSNISIKIYTKNDILNMLKEKVEYNQDDLLEITPIKSMEI